MTPEKQNVTSWACVSGQKKGSYRPTPEWWKRLVREELTRRGRGSRVALSVFVDCSTSAITQLLAPSKPGKPSPETSRIAAKVAEWTGIPLPDEASYDDMTELVSEAQRLKRHNPEALEQLVKMARSLRIAEEKAAGSKK